MTGTHVDPEKAYNGEPTSWRATFGTYYLTTFRIRTVAGETTPLTLAWLQEGGRWRIFAYKLESI